MIVEDFHFCVGALVSYLRKNVGKLYRHVLPVYLQKRLDVYRAKKYWIDSGVIFIHVPKAAGISISNAIYGRPLGHLKAKDIYEVDGRLLSEMFTFGFVRHPVNRFISGYSYIKENYHYLKGSPGLPSLEHLNLGPNEFVERWLSRMNLKKVNFVFQSQADFLYDDNDLLLVEKLCYYENFESEVENIRERVYKLEGLERLNYSGSKSVDFDYEDLNEVLKIIYPRDYDLLGYS